MKKRSGAHGFTLIELLVVIAIIGILASVILASLNSARAKARDSRRLSDMHELMTALELYKANYGVYPINDSVNAVGSRESSCYTGGNASVTPGGWITPLTPLVTNGYLSSLPTDPKNTGSSTGASNPNYCYVYFHGTSTSDIYNECKDTVTGELLQPGDYEYMLDFSLENPPAKRYMMNWAGSSNPPSNTCLVGPHK